MKGKGWDYKGRMDPKVGHRGETRVNNNQSQLVAPGGDASANGAEEQIVLMLGRVLVQRRALAKTQHPRDRSCSFQACCPVSHQSLPLFFCNEVPHFTPRFIVLTAGLPGAPPAGQLCLSTEGGRAGRVRVPRA